MRFGTTRAKKKIHLVASREFSAAFSGARRPPPLPSSFFSLPPENNENIDPRGNGDALSRRFPGPGELVYRLRSRRRQAPRVFRSESRAAFNARFFGCLLSKQTFRRCDRSYAPFSTAWKHVSALSAPPRDHITAGRT